MVLFFVVHNVCGGIVSGTGGVIVGFQGGGVQVYVGRARERTVRRRSRASGVEVFGGLRKKEILVLRMVTGELGMARMGGLVAHEF